MTRKGDWFQTYTGKRFYPYDPHPDDVVLEDIAHHLALQCRFNGACRRFYSVAQHSVLVSHHVPDADRLWALLHDASEAYLGDMVRPLKLGMDQYRKVEAEVTKAVASRFGLLLPEPALVSLADKRALYTERRDLLLIQRQWSDTFTPFEEKIFPWDPYVAEEEFLLRFNALTCVRPVVTTREY